MKNSFSKSKLVQNSVLKDIIWIAVIASIYFVIGRLSIKFIFEPEGIAAVWPASGIFLSAVLLTRRSLRPYLIGFLFLTDFMVEMYAGIPVRVSLVYAFALTFDASFSAWVLVRFFHEPFHFEKIRNVFGFILFAVILSNALASSIAALATYYLLDQGYLNSWKLWWWSDAVGNLLIAPLILSWASFSLYKLRPLKLKRFIEGTVLFVLVPAATYIAFLNLSGNVNFFFIINFLTFPFLIWAALRFRIRGVSTALVLLTVNLLYLTLGGHISVFSGVSQLYSILLVQAYLAIISVSSISLASVFTENNQIQIQLKRTSDQHRNILQTALDGFWVLGINGALLEVNEAYAKMSGYGIPELLTMNIADLEAIESKNETTDHMQMIMAEGVNRFESLHRRKDGSILELEISVQYRPDEGGRFVAFLHDITERKLNEKALQESEALYRNLVEVLPDGVYKSTHEGKFVDVNPAMALMLGYVSTEELMAIDIKTQLYFDVADRESVELQENNAETGIYRMKKKDGSEIWVEDHGWLNFDEKANILYHEGIMRDVTERKKNEEALVQSENKYRELVENSPDAIAIYIQGIVVYINNECLHLMAASSSTDLIGKPVMQFVHPDFRELVIKRMKKAAEEGIVLPIMEEKFIRLDGSDVDVEVKAMAIQFDNKPAVQLIIRDITDRKLAEEALHEREEKYRNLFNNSEVGMFRTRLDGSEILEFNNKYLKILNYTREEIEGKPSVNIWADKSEREKMVKILIAEGHVTDLEFDLLTKQGERRKCITSLRLYQDTGILEGSIYDITERKQAEEELKKLSTAVEQSPVSIVITDTDGNIEYGNPKIAEITGYNLSELIGKNPRIFSSGEKPKSEYQNLWATISSGHVWSGEFHNKKKNGDLYWEHASISPIMDDKGTITHYLAVKEDVTEQKKADQIQQVVKTISDAALSTVQLDELIEIIHIQLGKLLDTTNLYIAFYDERTGMLSSHFDKDEKDVFNSWPAEKSITGYVVRHKQSLLANDNDVMKLLETGEIEMIGTPSKVWLGVPLWLGNSVIGVIAVQNYDNQEAYHEKEKLMLEFIAGQVSTAIHRKKAEKDLLAALEKAEESDRLKSAFLANMSHEIRTPMNGILGFAELLMTPDLSGAKQQEYIRIIEKSGDRMLNIINAIIDISKIEAGQTNLAIAESNINEQIEFIYTFFKPEVDAKGMSLYYKNALSTEESVVNTDKEKVFAILTNLVKNAIKYSQEGSIEMGYTQKGDFLEFYVKDTGIGIPPDRQEAIFERFVQADIADKHAYQGAGLGLAISKAYVQMLGGIIWVESEEGKGSTFYFTLPWNPKSPKKEYNTDILLDQNDITVRKLKILIVEDDLASEMLISMAVEKISEETLKVKTGVEAVEACRNHPDIDLILMDFQIPEMNGYDATRQIRQFNQSVVIIGQTAYTIAGDREKAIAAGCNDYISKPIRIEDLMDLIQKYFKN